MNRLPTVPEAMQRKLVEASSLRVRAVKEIMKGAHRAPPPGAAADKIQRDTRVLELSAESAGIRGQALAEIKDNLKVIAKDAKEVSSTHSTTRRDHLKQALRLRMSALKEELREGSPEAHSRDDANLLAKVERDVNAVEEAAQRSGLGPRREAELEENLESLRKDAESMGHATGERREKLKNAMGLRMMAAKMQLKGDGEGVTQAAHITASRGSVTKVNDDILALEEHVERSSMPKALKSEIKGNLESISKDAHKVVGLSGKAREKMQKAISLRMSALRKEMATPSTERTHPSSTVPRERPGSAASRVHQDISELEEIVSRMPHVSAKLHRELQSNMKAIEKDADRVKTAPAAKKADLKKAMSMRMSALKKQMKAAQA